MGRASKDIRNVDVAGKRVLVRADLNVPINGGVITDATRIGRFVPTVKDLIGRGASVVITTHLGRPAPEVNPHFSTKPIASALSDALGTEVKFVPSLTGQGSETTTGNLQPGEVAVLENVRFDKGETENSRIFAQKLSYHGDIYVNDAFSCSHRSHASIDAITTMLPSYAGPSLIAELDALESVLERPEHPVAALVGGAKVSSKIAVLRHLVPKVDHLIVGGGMANTFLLALGYQMGKSLVEPDAVALARQILDEAEKAGCEIVLPSDLVVSKEFAANAENRVVPIDSVPADMMALDVGTETQKRISELLGNCRTLLWNGPLGAFEIEPFGAATFAVARAAADLTGKGTLKTVAGGGDTVAALNAAGVTDRFSYVSTAGGAFLEWLEGKELPGIAALMNSHQNREIA